ncbi:MAG TPA: T9SS type A sorting domain-containing protein [Chitinophagaceae bacterium]|nr:T9SS type A sorting domain-containing protein [Chitinophagaceae bacterium]
MKLCEPKAFPALKYATGRGSGSMIAFLFSFIFCLSSSCFGQQAVSGIITDYNSYWKTSVSVMNPVKPVNSHNLLAFTYNNTQYSTGVNDAALRSHGESFIAGDFWSLPVDNISGAIVANTKVGLGEMYDGVHNGASNPAPYRDIETYLTDGVKGLNIGTCIANLPVGSLTFAVTNIRPENIGDGIPDILVTQVADPSNSFDRYSFVNANGTIVGVSKDVEFTNIPPVANWTADFYESVSNPMILTAGFTNTDRPMRLWAADLSDLGITLANYQSVSKFKINLSGNSDVAFVAYNQRSFTVASILPLTLGDLTGQVINGAAKLNWNTQSEADTKHFVLEKSRDNLVFSGIDTIRAMGNSTTTVYYSSLDKSLQNGTTYYRLKMVDNDGHFTYSKTIQVQYNKASGTLSLLLYPNPASDKIQVSYPASQDGSLMIFSSGGTLLKRVMLNSNTTQTSLAVNTLAKGFYRLVWQGRDETLSQALIVQ